MFPFFSLPRELRDIIYTQSLITSHSELENGLRCTANSVPSKDCMLVCRQFQQEYRERAAQLSRLVLSDSATFRAHRSSVVLSPAARRIRNLQIDIFCAPPFITLDHHRQWLSPVLEQMRQLLYVNIKIVIRYDADIERVEALLIRDGFWLEHPRLRLLTVFEALKGSNALDFSWQTDVVLGWKGNTKGAGTLKRLESLELSEMSCLDV